MIPPPPLPNNRRRSVPIPREQDSLGEVINATAEEKASAAASGSGDPFEMVGDPPPPPVKVVTCCMRGSISPSETGLRNAAPAPRDPSLPRSSNRFSYESFLGEFQRPAERIRPEDWVDYRCEHSTMVHSRRRGLWNRSKGWNLKFGPDPDGVVCSMKLYPIIMHSHYLRDRFEQLQISPRGSEHLNSEIDIPDCPFYPPALKLADSHCTGATSDSDFKDLSNENLLNLMRVSRFLAMNCLTIRASTVLQAKLDSQEGCANLLTAFKTTDISENGEHRPLFENCMVLLRQKMLEKYDADLEAMVGVASVMPEFEAESFFEFCRLNWCGLYHRTRLDYEEKDYEFSVFSHATCDGSVNRRIRDSYMYKPCPWACGRIATEIDSRLSSMADVNRRGILVLGLARALIGTRLKKSRDEIHLGTTRVSWDFLCILMNQAGGCFKTESFKLFGVDVLKAHAHDHSTRVGHDELSHMEWMVASCLASPANPWLWIKYGRARNAAVWGLELLHFESLLGVVNQIAVLYPSIELMEHITKALDMTVSGKLSGGVFTVGEALAIYTSFPRGYRTSHLEIFRIFEAKLHGQGMSIKEIAELARLLDIEKIPYAVVELLAHALSVTCTSDEKLLELCGWLDRNDKALPAILEKIAKDVRLAHDLSVRFMSKEIQTDLCNLLDWRGPADDAFFKVFDKLIDTLKEERCSYVLFNTFWSRKIYDPALRSAARDELMKLQLELGLRLNP